MGQESRAREEAKRDIFDHVEMLDNPKRRHSFSNDMSLADYERQYFSTTVEYLEKSWRFNCECQENGKS